MNDDYFDLNNFWKSVQDRFADNMGETAYENWIRPVRAASVDLANRTVSLQVPSDLVMQAWDNGNYTAKFMEYAYDVAHDFFKPDLKVVKVVVNPVNNSNQTSSNFQTNDYQLNPAFTFDTWVVGDANELATSAAMAVSEQPGRQYNPLLIYGSSGLGKTHLMEAIGNRLKEVQPNAIVRYITTDDFMNDWVNAISKKSTSEFTDTYENVDLLLVDDIQMLQGKDRFQEEFFNIFNKITKAQKQIVMTSDVLPKDIPGLNARLVSRFMQGVAYDIQKPDFPTRLAILKNKSEEAGMQIDNQTLTLIAEQIDTNVRELEGAFNTLTLMARAGRPINVANAQKILEHLNISRQKVITVSDIQRIVAEDYGVGLSDLLGKKRNSDIVLPRQVAMYLIRTLTDTSLPKIGQAFGGRDHTTVMHGTEKIADLIETDYSMKQRIETLSTKIKEKS
ncbi:MAG: chromosomal replication initiator protein DnaA [Oenococcus sp.]|uniref:Chromosomal replication initiator protein DnaA n=1 Tax=Oenococcus kitaharae DSM 17330 TaxID=1045004 RepID=G9WF02_9LACO|nr:chromosomal replication initiator protein DnaA [Oenococcus kitaharae]EHN58562.1 DnaA-like chromosomal replication initiator protein [Oenococcus kitaharae DSM 17330]MCV3296211.1 chromosomal replication initiator protein DnaA [Oenococcus kitaharae]